MRITILIVVSALACVMAKPKRKNAVFETRS
jgi:hypothetical protein